MGGQKGYQAHCPPLGEYSDIGIVERKYTMEAFYCFIVLVFMFMWIGPKVLDAALKTIATIQRWLQ